MDFRQHSYFSNVAIGIAVGDTSGVTF